MYLDVNEFIMANRLKIRRLSLPFKIVGNATASLVAITHEDNAIFAINTAGVDQITSLKEVGETVTASVPVDATPTFTMYVKLHSDECKQVVGAHISLQKPDANIQLTPCKLEATEGVTNKGNMLFSVTLKSPTGPTAPVLGPDLQGFSVLGGSAVTNTGSSVITGDLGSSPTGSITGFPPGTVSGTIHSADSAAAAAQVALTALYTDLASRPYSQDLTGIDLGGLVKGPGVYKYSTSAGLTGTLTLDGQGDPNSVFIFQIGSTLTTASASSVVLINGALPGNVYWQIGSSATLGTTTSFQGNIVALTSATTNSRLLARNGAVTLNTNNASTVTGAGGSVALNAANTVIGTLHVEYMDIPR